MAAYSCPMIEPPQLTKDDIPDELVPLIAEFRLPTGAIIRSMIASHHNISGWVIEIMPRAQYLYADGVVRSAPRSQAYVELGFPGGEDDLKSEDDWQRVAEREAKLIKLMFMPIEQAWAVAKASGIGNRRVVVGEAVTVRSDRYGIPIGTKMIIIDPGSANDYGWLRGRLPDGSEKTIKLSGLQLDS
jgi:hypothetical protein